jgi:hypothetical protein
MAATLEDFILFTNYQDLEDGEKDQISYWLEVAEELILDFTNGKWLNNNNSSITADSRQILIVRRYFDNQKDVVAVSVDGTSENYSESSSGGLRLTAEDKQALGRLNKVVPAFSSVSFHKNYGNIW